MKKLLIFLFAALSFTISWSQTVENIRVEADGENINIHYRIGGSVEGDVYNVFLSCSMDGGPKFEPKTVMGDVNENIRGGKSNYTIIWDVFEDLEEIGSAEFFIKVEKVGGVEEVVSNTFQDIEPVGGGADYRKFMLAYSMGFNVDWDIYNAVGISIGTLGNWGWYASFRIGGYVEYDDSFTGSIIGGATKRILNNPNYRLHGYVGIGLGDYFDEFDVELGVTNVINNRWVINFGFEYPYWYLNTVFGVGLVF